VFYGKEDSRNGLSTASLNNVQKMRQNNQDTIKDALSSIDSIIRDFQYSFYKRNPNLLLPNGGLLMMREKSTMDVIK